MADDADRAQVQQERMESALLAVRAPIGPMPTGHCLWCRAPLPDLRRWCGAECRDQWQAAQRH